MTTRSCKALNRNGGACGAFALVDSDYCFIHDPSQAAKRAAARRAGGMRQRPGHSGADLPGEVKTMADVLGLLNYALQETAKLENGVNRSRVLVAIAAGFVQCLQVGELEARV